MTLRCLLLLLTRHLRQHPGRVALAFGVLLAAALQMQLLAQVGGALRFRLGTHLARVFPEERLRLEAGRAALGPIALEGRPITDETLASLRALPGVAEVIGIEPVRVPVRVQGRLFGQDLTSDAVIHGAPREMIADALKPGQAWQKPANPTDACPLVASRYFLDLYNLGLARAAGLPLLNPDSVIGKELLVVFGESSVGMFRSAQPQVVLASIVGFSSDPGLIGLAMPPDVIRHYNLTIGGERSPRYVQAIVRLKPGTDAEACLKAAAPLGLALSGGEMLGRQLKSAVRVFGWTLLGLALGVLTLGLLTFYALFSLMLHARREDLIRLRALGMAPRGVLVLALGEVAAPALAAVVLSGLLSLGLLRWIAGLASAWLADQSWLPPGLFQPSTPWLVLGSLAILAIAMIPALPVLRWVYRVEPGTVLRDL